MSALAENRRPLIERIQSIRRSLRSATGLLPQESPVEEYERRRSERRLDATEQTAASLLGWLISHSLTLFCLLAAFNSGEPISHWESWQFLGPVFFGLTSLGFAIVSAAIAIRHASILRRRWLAAGLLPWAALIAESTFALSKLW